MEDNMSASNNLRLIGDEVIDEMTGVVLFRATEKLTPAARMALQERELLSTAGRFRVPRHRNNWTQEG